MNQDLLFFKNDMLLDIRKVEQRFNLKLTEQSVISSEQYDIFEKKLIELSERVSKIQSLLFDSRELTEKIKTFLIFKAKAEETFNKINSKIMSFQKQNGVFIDNIEKMISENLRYPGVIGKNGKFLNFRYFIDYTIRNLCDLNEFRDEIKILNFDEIRRKINKDISEFRSTLSDNYKNSVLYMDKNFREFDAKVEALIKRNNKKMKENEEKFEELKNNFNKYFSEIQTQFEFLKKNLDEKYKDELNEIENLKNMKNELLMEINDVKSYLEKIKSLKNNNDINSNIKENDNSRNHFKNGNQNNNQSDDNNNNILFNKDETLQIDKNSGNFNYQTIQIINKKSNIITKELINNNNNNNYILDNNMNNEYHHNIELPLNKNLHHIVRNRSNSFEKLSDNNSSKIRDNSKDLSPEYHEIENKEEKNEFDFYYNTINKEAKINNYSISNIANIKLNKVILPEYINKRKINRVNSLVSENKGTKHISNDLSSSIPQKSIYLNDNSDNMGKTTFNISKISRQRNHNKINISHSTKEISKKVEIKNPEIINSLIIIKPKLENNFFKNLDFSKKVKKYNLSFDKGKNSKDEQIQIGFRRTINLKNKIKELILMADNKPKYNFTIF